MNKQTLIDALSKKYNLSKSMSNDIISSLLDEIKNSVKKGNTVQLIGFGTWKKSKRKARLARNPQTGAEIKVKARNVVKFSAGKAFKDILN